MSRLIHNTSLFRENGRAAQRAGAVGLVVADNTNSTELIRMALDDTDAAYDPVTIPAVFITSRSAYAILKLLAETKAPLSVRLSA